MTERLLAELIWTTAQHKRCLARLALQDGNKNEEHAELYAARTLEQILEALVGPEDERVRSLHDR